jgi:hypothetical protein
MKDARASRSGYDQAAGAVSPFTGRTELPRRLALALLVASLLSAHSAAAQLHQPVIILLSQTARGFSAEGRSEAPVVNENGLVAAYSSDAIDLVSPPLQTARNQVYARDVDLITSALVSQSASGAAGNRVSQDSGFPPGINGDGHLVAFSSRATNLVAEDTGGTENVYVYDLQQNAIELISRGIDGPPNGASTLPKLSADGRYVVFQSIATNLIPNDSNGRSKIFIFDRTAGQMTLVSVGFDGSPVNGNSITANISEDGHAVAFASRATNLVATPATTGTFEQIFVTQWQTPSTQLASVSSAGQPGNAISFLPDLNRDGTQVAFKSEAFNLVPNDTNGWPDVFVRDSTTGITQRVSVDSFGNQANGLSGGPGISADGRFVAFPSFASNLVPEDGNGQSDVYVYDRFPPGRPQGQIAIVTVGLDGKQPNNGVSDFPVTISADGRWIGFASAASNLVPNDFNNSLDAFLACNPFDTFACAPPTPTPTPPGEKPCVGDCNGDGQVTIDDLIRMVNIALGLTPICPNDVNGGCLAGDANCDCEITVDEIIRAVQNSLQGCHDFGDCTVDQLEQMCCEAPPIGTPTETRTPTPTPPPVTPADTPTVTPTMSGAPLCVGDCNDSGSVTIDDLIRMVNIALDLQPICPSEGGGGCLAGDSNCNCEITVEEIIQAVNNDLNGCTTFNTCPPAEHAAMCCG